MESFEKKQSNLSLVGYFKGKNRLSKLFYNNQEMLAKPYELEMKYGTKIVVKNLVDNIGYNIFINGAYEPELVNHLIINIPIGGSFIDVGANIGSISIPLAYKRPDISIICIEASPSVFEFLKYNVELNNLTNITLVNKAIHKEDNIILDFFAPEDKFGKGSFSNVFTNNSEKVVTVRMDSLIKQYNIKPDFIKVDVEGYESYVFESLMGYLKSNNKNPTIIFEFVDWCERIALGESGIGKAQQILLDLGYKLFEFANQKNEIMRPLTANSCDIIVFYK